jgi:hypothetical protein
MNLRHTVGDVVVHALLKRRAAGDLQEPIRWSAKDMMRTYCVDAWMAVTDCRLRAMLDRLTHNKTGNV